MLNDVGTLLARLTLGGAIAAHGAQKQWGAFEGPGPQGAAAFMGSLGFVPGERFAAAASASELTAGALIAAGLGGPLGPGLLISTMIVAQATVHAKNGFFAQKNGVELGVLYVTAALALAASGPGRFSLDEALGWQKLREPGVTALGIVAGIAGALVVLAQRVPPAGSPAHEPSDTSDSLTAAGARIAAAAADRPVPAELIVAAEDSAS